ncbi:aromatic acid exporter family protein [Paraburkholderia hospita]|uniref:aromatic acid exporter family protein n=1 Tax=Paraburkholderia hospita TaxID=169430 RepID=UPI000B341653|nr:aromatic acid exporter family protein [Paraburkholderia hospita]OUL69313.1 FUSC family protein [Paraburkholderia hospita]
MSTASYAHKPLTPFHRALARFSLSENAKYVKLALGLWIGYWVPYSLGYPEAAVALASSTMLTLALGSSISAARGYFYRRVMSNVVAMPIATLVIWLTAPHLLLGTLLLPLVIFAIVRLRPSLFQMTSITIPMTLVLYTGEHLPLLEQRLIGVVLGMLLGFIIQQIVFPPDHGFWANRLVNDGNEQALQALGQLASGEHDSAQLKTIIGQLRKSSTDLKESHGLLKLDLEQAWMSPHLQRNRDRLPLFWCYHELFDSLVNFLETLDTFHEQFTALDPRWREAFLAGLARLLDAHGKLALVADLRVERAALEAKPLQMDALRDIVDTLPAPGVFTSVYLGHLTGYGILLCRLSDMHTQHLAAAQPSTAT